MAPHLHCLQWEDDTYTISIFTASLPCGGKSAVSLFQRLTLSYATPHIDQSCNWSHYTVFSSLIDLLEGWGRLVTKSRKKSTGRDLCICMLSQPWKKGPELVCLVRKWKRYLSTALCSQTPVTAEVASYSFNMHSHRIRLTFLLSGPITMPHP